MGAVESQVPESERILYKPRHDTDDAEKYALEEHARMEKETFKKMKLKGELI